MPHEFIDHIKAFNPGVARQKTFCVFLVTPSYAQHLLDDDFLHEALKKIYYNTSYEKGFRVDALCAVVDKLPIRRFKYGDRDEELSRRATEPPTAGTGLEGMTYVLLTPADSVSSQSLSPSDKGAIDFIFAQHVFNDTTYQDTLRLPLSNTVFQTGMPSTMILSTWKNFGEGQGLILESKRNVSHHGIRLIEQVGHRATIPPVLNVPLIPLTMPRLVEGCMGNIIRGIIGPEGKAMQASSELENVVPRFFRSRGQPAQATVAWALVIPGELRTVIAARTDELLSSLPMESEDTPSKQEDSWERLWRSNPPLWNTLVSKAITEGARLHRVLSGGGGWGKKAGLLSLDPVPANEAAEPSKHDDLPNTINDPEDFESTLTPVVRDGDSIQFFISPKSDLEKIAQETNTRRLASIIPKRHWGWELGTIPSTIDSVPGESWQHRPRPTKKIHVHHGFGALTEGPMTLTRHSHVNSDKDFTVNVTTIDVPFSRLSAPTYTRTKVDARIKYTKKEGSPKKDVELVRKLKIEGHATTGRLRVRTAKAIMRRFEKSFDKNKMKHREIMTMIRRRDVRLTMMRFKAIMVEAANLVEEANFVLGNNYHTPVRRISSKKRGKSERQNLAGSTLKREETKAGKAPRAEPKLRKEIKAEKEKNVRPVSSTTTGVPIRKFLSLGTTISIEINKRVQSGVLEVSRLTEEARAVLAAIQQYRPKIRRMPVSKLATPQALNQTLGYAIQEILHLTEEARTIMATIQQRKRQSSWRFIRRWGRDADLMPIGPGTSPMDLLAYARRNSRTWQLGIQHLKKEVNMIKTRIRQRKRAHRKSVTGSPRITKEERLRVRRVRHAVINVVQYPSRSWVVRKQPVSGESSKARLLRLRQKVSEKKSKKEGLALTVEQWLTGGGSYGG
ncbi:unnamed protein product [Alternaria alternata]